MPRPVWQSINNNLEQWDTFSHTFTLSRGSSRGRVEMKDSSGSSNPRFIVIASISNLFTNMKRKRANIGPLHFSFDVACKNIRVESSLPGKFLFRWKANGFDVLVQSFWCLKFLSVVSSHSWSVAEIELCSMWIEAINFDNWSKNIKFHETRCFLL